MTDRVEAHWTEAIHKEWIYNLLKIRPDLTEEQLLRTRDLMNKAVLGALVSGYQHRIEALTLPDPDDRHVLAVALEAGADIIVTFNRKDFPAEILEPFDVEAIHPDRFVTMVIEEFPEEIIQAARRQREALQTPPKSAAEFLEMLRTCKLTQTADWLRQHIEEI